MKKTDWCGHTWLIIGFKRKDVNGVRGAVVERDSKLDQVFSDLTLLSLHLMQLCNTTGSSDVLAPKAQPFCLALAAMSRCMCMWVCECVKCLCVLPVTGSLMLVTAVGSEQKAVYFQSINPPHRPIQHAQTFTEWVSGRMWGDGICLS